MGTEADVATEPTDKDARWAHLDLSSTAHSLKYSLYDHLAAFGHEISVGDAHVEAVKQEARQRQAEIDDLGPWDDPPDDELPPWVNVDIAREIHERDKEAMLGVSFVLCQTRITGINAKADRLYDVLEQVLGLPTLHFPRGKAHLARGEKLAGFDYSKVRVIYELANYFKHADQWVPETWEHPSRFEQQTIEVVKAIGLSEHSSLKQGAQALGIEAGHEVVKMAEEVYRWAQLVVSEAKEAMAPLPPEPEPDF